MPRRHILTERQRHALLALPTNEPSPLKHYTFAEDDLEHIRHHRRLQQQHYGLGQSARTYAEGNRRGDETLPQQAPIGSSRVRTPPYRNRTNKPSENLSCWQGCRGRRRRVKAFASE